MAGRNPTALTTVFVRARRAISTRWLDGLRSVVRGNMPDDTMPQSSVLVFGVFDGFHEGHRNFLRQARRLGEHLTVVVARDDVVTQLKGREPRLLLAERMRTVAHDDAVDAVVQGDALDGSWGVVRKHRPSIIALGHDQEAMRQELEKSKDQFGFPVALIVTRAHHPERYSSRLLSPRDK